MIPTLASASEKCFDYSKKLMEPLKQPLTLKSNGGDASLSGMKNGVQTGEVRGVVKMPTWQILKLFEDPYLTKNRKNTVITKTVTKSPHYLWIRTMHLNVRPVFLVSVEWDEQWAVSLRQGTPDAPQSFIVYYQKIAGTSHVDRLCGNILVTAIDGQSSDVYLYEEVQSSHWSGEDAVRNFLMVLKIFRGEHKDY